MTSAAKVGTYRSGSTVDANSVKVYVWTGDAEIAERVVKEQYPGLPVTVIPIREVREAGWKQRLATFRSHRGRAVVFFFESLSDAQRLRLLPWCGLLHRCRETVIADETGKIETYTWKNYPGLLPGMLASFAGDVLVLSLSRVFLAFWDLLPKRAHQFKGSGELNEIAYLYPFPLQQTTPGGEMTYLSGTLAGWAQQGIPFHVFSGCPLPLQQAVSTVIPNRRRWYLFRELQALAYNVRFVLGVKRALHGKVNRVLYQRHGRFVVAGMVLARMLRLPLVLEYQMSEQWRARNWDPSLFQGVLRRCEDASIAAADAFVVLSQVLRDELITKGVPPEKIVVNPAGVDPERFRPGCNGQQVRAKLGFDASDVVVSFVGSFSYWHGIPVLQQAIQNILGDPTAAPRRLRFMLIGGGILHQEMRDALKQHEVTGQVIFPGKLPHHDVPSYLDASDILVSPHLPVSDAEPFFGSPTKLFEYMAMGKAIVASNLDQLSTVLEHGRTGWLVQPGNVQELVAAIVLLADDQELRLRLGRNVREVAISRHTWRQNAVQLLTKFGDIESRSEFAMSVAS